MKKLLLLALCLPNIIYAQSYLGYLGKKNILSVSANSGLSTFSQYGKNYNQRYFRPTIAFNLAYEFCYKKSLSFGGTLQYMGSNYNSNTVGRPLSDALIEAFPRLDYRGTCKSSLLSIGGFVRKYLTSVGGMAPHGVYLEHGLHLNNIIVRNFNIDSFAIYPPVKSARPHNLSYLSYSFFIGKHHISNKKFPLYYDLALGLNVTTALYGKMNSEFFNPDEPFVANFPDFGSMLKCYYANLNFTTVRFGVGYLF